MTRDEAEELAFRAVGIENCEEARANISILEALGLLKLSESVDAKQKFLDAMDMRGWVMNDTSLRHSIEDSLAGLQIIEKGQ